MASSIAACGSAPIVVARIKPAPAPQHRISVSFSRRLGSPLRRGAIASIGGSQWLRKQDCGISCKAKNLTEDEFEAAVLKSELPVLVDFWAEWCGPCKLVAPVVDWASEEYAGKLEVYKVDTDKSPGLVEKYKLYGLPTLVMFKNGGIVSGSRREGAITKAKIKSYLDDFLQSVAA
ncbi:uncharacterized protein LOC9657219 [Selaginella moellendorffii]|nr:uncharacterized protein LOC9657219 [Selaginella moellendorffii]XP_024535616.1 uncharacterized protein LOC9657219 [Selaginella moellendorffii]|eukprot:XP_002961945.2 uncharacterized protein LOC9657219 [Selaginella moellendorffii]